MCVSPDQNLHALITAPQHEETPPLAEVSTCQPLQWMYLTPGVSFGHPEQSVIVGSHSLSLWYL